MRFLNSDYVVQEVINTANMMQLNNETIPELSSDEISNIASDFIYEWGEVGDFDADVSYTLLTFMRYRFAKF